MIYPRSSLAENGAQKAVNLVVTSVSTSWLKTSSRQILQKIVYLSVFHALTKRRITRSCFPGRQYFMKATGLHQSTISTITSELAGKGLIEKFQRRPERNQWSTCLYKLSGTIRAIAKAVTIEFLRILDRVAFLRHIVSKEHSTKIFREENKVSNPHSLAPPENLDYITKMEVRFPELIS